MKRLSIIVCALLLLSSLAARADVIVQRGTASTTASIAYNSSSRGTEIIFMNTGTADIFIGPSGVTTANGFEVKADTQLRTVLLRGEALYVIVAAATEPYQVLVVPQR